MYKEIRVFLIALALMLGLSGCANWMNGSYVSVKPHNERPLPSDANLIAPVDYNDLLEVLCHMVDTATRSRTISVKNFRDDYVQYMSDALEYIQNSYCMGVFAVSHISYEAGTNGGADAIQVNITFSRSIGEIRSVVQVEDLEGALVKIYESLDNCSSGIILSVDAYSECNMEQMVRDYGMDYPQRVMELPNVAVLEYPGADGQCVIELDYTYENSRELLQEMQMQVLDIFDFATQDVANIKDDLEKFKHFYSFLMNHEYLNLHSSTTPAYSLLLHGVGDSKAFSTVYASLCRTAGLECHTVYGTRNGVSWYWNIITLNGKRYYVDLLRCYEKGGYFYRTADEMKEYVWDYSAYQ